MLPMLKLLLSLVLPFSTPDAIDERAHVACYALLDTPLIDDPFASATDADAMCDGVDGEGLGAIGMVIPW